MVQERTLPAFEPQPGEITKAEGLMLYRDMILGRFFEDKCAEMYYRGKMFGFVHLYNGQEAVASGVIKAMRVGQDYVSSTYRDHVHALSAGVPAREVMAELFGKETGCSKGRGGSMHMFSREHQFLGGYAFIAEGIPVATGAAFASKYRREALGDAGSDLVSACFFGDGAANNGQFFECLNMAALWKLPMLYVIENNKWAIGMSHERATSVPEIFKKGAAFGMHGVEVDGMDVLAVYRVAKEAIARARAGEGPTLIEALTYRFRGHSLADPDELRSKEEKEFWLARDPIEKFAKYLVESGLMTQAEIAIHNKEIQAVVDDSVEFAENSPEPNPDELRRYIFAGDS
jgi:pyruvate dehydrogenase E1 component alpha subunit